MVFCFDGKGLIPHIAGGEETGPGPGSDTHTFPSQHCTCSGTASHFPSPTPLQNLFSTPKGNEVNAFQSYIHFPCGALGWSA